TCHVPSCAAVRQYPAPPPGGAAPGALVLPPENHWSLPPEFHQLEPFSITARQSIVSVFGSALKALLTLVMSQFASRLESSPQQPSRLDPQIAPVSTSLIPQMFTKFR